MLIGPHRLAQEENSKGQDDRYGYSHDTVARAADFATLEQ